MNILIIDDQMDVVQGIVKGIDWRKLGLKEISTAYSVAEAKEIFYDRQIDLMLCDIEMPRENGLELFSWVREHYKEVECIFLTSHAEFEYAKRAIELKSFDYILQPARYEVIEEVILRAVKRIKEKRKDNELYHIGRIFQDWEEDILNSEMERFIENNEDNYSLILKLLEKKGEGSLENKMCTPILIHVMRWKADLNVWGDGLLEYAYHNILKELLEAIDYSLGKLITLDSAHFFCLIQDREQQNKNADKLAGVLQYFIEFSAEYFKTEMALYVGERAFFSRQGGCLKKLRELMQNNIMQKERVEFYLGTSNREEKKEGTLKFDLKRWYDLLMKGHGRMAREEILRKLNEMAEKEQMNSRALKEFHQDFIQIIFSAANEKGWNIGKLFASQQECDQFMEEYHTFAELVYWIERMTKVFEGPMERKGDEKTQVEKVKEYIYQNIDKNITRTELADYVYLNSEYLSRLFKKETGYSLKDYILNEKVNVAKSLLANTNLSVSIVASKVGYSNFSHFSQVFKKVEEMSPGDYRKMYRNNGNER